MRDIKFRAWHKDSSKWIDNFAIVFTGSDEPRTIDDVINKRRQEVSVFEVNCKIECGGHGVYYQESTLDSFYGAPKIKNVIIQQYTGAKDKNEKKIYEGDIVQAYDSQGNITFCGNVVYSEQLASFVFVSKGSVYYITSYPLEIIGNIFELPCKPDHNRVKGRNFADTI